MDSCDPVVSGVLLPLIAHRALREKPFPIASAKPLLPIAVPISGRPSVLLQKCRAETPDNPLPGDGDHLGLICSGVNGNRKLETWIRRKGH